MKILEKFDQGALTETELSKDLKRKRKPYKICRGRVFEEEEMARAKALGLC